MRRRTRLAPIVKVTKEIEETAMPRRLMSGTIDGGAAIVYSVKDSEYLKFQIPKLTRYIRNTKPVRLRGRQEFAHCTLLDQIFEGAKAFQPETRR